MSVNSHLAGRIEEGEKSYRSNLFTGERKPRRILLLVEASSGGVGRHVIDLANALLECGHLIHLLYSARRVDDRFSKGMEQLVPLGLRACEVDIRHGLHLGDVRAIYSVRRYVRMNGPFDILHCHSTKAGFIGRLAALGMGCRTVYTPHGLVTNAPLKSPVYLAVAGWLERRLAALGDSILCVSKEEKRHALDIGLPEAKLHIVQNGIDLRESELHLENRPAMRARFSLHAEEICVGFVGRMIPGKAPELLLEAFAIAREDLTVPSKLIFVGRGPEELNLSKAIMRLKLQKDVMLVGELVGLQAMAAFDIFVLPSLSEAFPYVILEALSLGLPIVSTDVGGVTELVNEGYNGFVAEKTTPVELAKALRKLLFDAGLRARFGDGSKKMSVQFSLARMAHAVIKRYEELLS